MRSPLIFGALVATAFFAAPTGSAHANYCLNGAEDGYTTCGFVSFAQCMQAQHGNGGNCEVDLAAARPGTQPQSRARANR